MVTATDNATNSYQFTNFGIANLNNKSLYYRLKMQDKDVSFTYSPIVAVALVNKTIIALSPNPTTNIAWLQVQSTATEQLKIKVIDISGKEILVQNQTINTGSVALPINVSSLKAGVYYVQVISNYRNETLKLVKQ